MRYKLFSLLILSFIFTSGFAQSTVTILINGIKKGEYTISTDQTNTDLIIKKADCKKMKQLMVQVKGELTASSVYKRSLSIADTNDKVFLLIPETKAGFFTIAGTKIRALIQKGAPVKFVLSMEPVNEKLMIASRYIYMGSLTAK